MENTKEHKANGTKQRFQFRDVIIELYEMMHRPHYFWSKRARETTWVFLEVAWVVLFSVVSLFIFRHYSAMATQRWRDSLAAICDGRAGMLQDWFNDSVNHVHAMSVLISTFHHAKNPSAIDQWTFARYTERTSFDMPLINGVAYAVKVLHPEREDFEKQQGWTIKSMDSIEQNPVHKGDFSPESLESSAVQDEYAPVIFAQDVISHVISLDMLSGQEDRNNVLRARASGKGVLTAPFRLLKTNRLGVILTFAVYKEALPLDATSDERIQATNGYLGGVFDTETLVEKLLRHYTEENTVLVDVYDTTNRSNPISMYSSNASEGGMLHISTLNFGDPMRKHEMHCRFKERLRLPASAIMCSGAVFVISILIGYIVYGAVKGIAKVKDDFHEMMELKRQAEAAHIAKSQVLATVSHEIRNPMNGLLGMLEMVMDADLDITQQDCIRTAKDCGKAIISITNEVLDQAKIEAGMLQLVSVSFDIRDLLDDMLLLFSGRCRDKGIELAVYVSDSVPQILIGDPGRFRQIITNLMVNSIKFTEKGHIFITVCRVEDMVDSMESPAGETLSGMPVADKRRSWSGFGCLFTDKTVALDPTSGSVPVKLLVSCEDTGVGIALDAQPRVFTPYMQLGSSSHGTGGGTGIGLTISSRLVHLMNGEIGFASTPWIGSTFSFTAVLKCGPRDRRARNDPEFLSSRFNGMKAILVDHRPVRAKVSQYHVQRLGIRVKIVSDLMDALHFIENGGGRHINFFLVEQEIWENNKCNPTLVFDKLLNLGHGSCPKPFILANSVNPNSTKAGAFDSRAPFVILKPLRSSMLAAFFHRPLGVSDGQNTGTGKRSSPLHSLLIGRKILIVDDSSVNLRVAAGALKRYGADVACVDSGKKAIALLTPPHEFEACFMDLQMPGVDGYEATRVIRNTEDGFNSRSGPRDGDVACSNFRVPILAMTADVIHTTYQGCVECGMDGYVRKPFDAEELYREVSRFF